MISVSPYIPDLSRRHRTLAGTAVQAGWDCSSCAGSEEKAAQRASLPGKAHPPTPTASSLVHFLPSRPRDQPLPSSLLGPECPAMCPIPLPLQHNLC